MEILNGKLVSNEYLNDLKKKIAENNYKICLAIISVGEDEASNIYIKNKIKTCEELGINSLIKKFADDVTESKIIKEIEKLNNDNNVHGIILQSPIPKHLNFNALANLINSDKDVDGFTALNVYNNYLENEAFIPCTALGIIKLLDYYNIELKGKHVVIVGRSIIVGKPLMLLCLSKDATVTVCHSKTENLKSITKKADILISATGKVNLITSRMVKFGAIVVDVGITRYYKKLHGDVDFENVKRKCKYITPVPGGVGPMTVAMLMYNTVLAYERSKHE